MILASIEIENYKQYGGSHGIDFPEQGMIAITGPNGAGKTTLFEAIEWCLYGPRAILLGTIPPHGGVGLTRVRVTLQDANDGRRHVVQRVLKNGVSSAEAYAEDDPGQPVVQGPRDVTDYVAKQLVGLPHGAFVSTFFTRQKELTFFGDRTPTDRRVEVARLLGFETIRDAQEDIGLERHQARQTALHLSARYAHDSQGRDFPEEIAAAELTLEDARELEAGATRSSTTAEAAAERARTALDGWRELQERDNALGAQMADIAGQMAGAASRGDAAIAELERLDQRESDRATLFPEAETVAPLAFEVTLLDGQRERAETLRALQDVRRRADERTGAIAQRLRRLVADHRADAASIADWTWAETDGNRPEIACRRLIQAAATIDANAAGDHVDRLRHAVAVALTVAEQARICDRYQEHHHSLSTQRLALIAEGEPGEAVAAAHAAARQAREISVGAKEALARLKKSREDAVRIARELRGRAEEPLCPTCARPLGAAEAERLARLLDDDVRGIQEKEVALRRDEKAASARIADAEREEAVARRRQDDLTTLDARLAGGLEKIAEADAAHHRALTELQSCLGNLGISASPTESEIATARETAAAAQRVVAVIPLLEQFGDEAAVAGKDAADAVSGIDELGPVTYDAAAHGAARTALERARAAATRIEQIDRELAGRPRYEEQRAASAGEVATLTARQTALAAERAAVGFDAERLRLAHQEEAAARTASRAAREESAQARETLREVRAWRDRLVEERDRLLKLAEDADRRGREADDLDRMHREFAEFDKFVADHVGPLLAETTERLLSLVTHGKYDRVRFDESYGIEVFDGDECFKLEGFSGGERDIVALCARLAMSELVGSAAVRPPRFLVLDEVFGSLDSERRAQLLETLGSLASSGHFQQMFIISHVDDVQLSPVMNEAWTIEERDGVSHITRPELLAASLV